jgi:hypothetical protein
MGKRSHLAEMGTDGESHLGQEAEVRLKGVGYNAGVPYRIFVLGEPSLGHRPLTQDEIDYYSLDSWHHVFLGEFWSQRKEECISLMPMFLHKFSEAARLSCIRTGESTSGGWRTTKLLTLLLDTQFTRLRQIEDVSRKTDGSYEMFEAAVNDILDNKEHQVRPPSCIWQEIL